VVRPETRCARKPARARSTVVGGPKSRDRCNGWAVGEAHLPAHERQPEPAEVHAEGAAGVERVAELPSPVDEAAQVPPGRVMPQRQLDFTHRQVRARGVDRHPDLAAEACGDREAGAARSGRQCPLAGQRLSRLETCEDFDQGSGDSLRETEASPLTLYERRDVEIAAAVEKWRELSREICIAEEQGARWGGALGRGQRLALSPTWQPQDDRTCGLGCVCRAVSRTVVGHDHLGVGKRPPHCRDGLPDDVFLVACRDEDRQRLIHRPPVGATVRSAAAAASLTSCRSRRRAQGRRARRSARAFRTAGRRRPQWRGRRRGMP